ncbi:hypothetical protein [Parasphingorhabdus cellanae]|nr:hypothetical protein [Parasphingorhabdus cellanae]
MTDKIKIEEARQGEPRRMVRQTLAWSLPLAVIGLGVVAFLFLF